MKKSLLLFLLCFGIGFVHAAPVEDEPLPFDSRMPSRSASTPPDAPARVEPEARATSRSVCKTVVRKVRGRKVRQQVCHKAGSRAEVRSSRLKAGSKARHAGKKVTVRKKAVVKSRKRR